MSRPSTHHLVAVRWKSRANIGRGRRRPYPSRGVSLTLGRGVGRPLPSPRLNVVGVTTMEPDTVFELCRRLLRPGRACAYYKVDLHVHSPASFDYRADGDIEATAFVQAFVDRGFDLVAITDHHSGEFVDRAKEAARAIANELGANITIVAGVELDTSTGVHLIALLPDACGTAEIGDLLSSLGVLSREVGDTADRR